MIIIFVELGLLAARNQFTEKEISLKELWTFPYLSKDSLNPL